MMSTVYDGDGSHDAVLSKAGDAVAGAVGAAAEACAGAKGSCADTAVIGSTAGGGGIGGGVSARNRAA